MTAFLKVIEAGAFTTVQDLGRFGFRRFGVPPSGALDRCSHLAANMLVENPDEAATLELTFMGGKFEILGEACIAIGGDLSARLNGHEINPWRSFKVQPGDHLETGQVCSGCRAYLAVNGGLEVPVVMGSRSTCVGARMGGFEGRALIQGDTLARMDTPLPQDCWRLPQARIPEFKAAVILRIIRGPQEGYFDGGIQALLQGEYRVSPDAGRSGYRLEGPKIAIADGRPASIISEPSLAGSVQIPENGQPIILLNEQTVGGYAKIGAVIQPDIDRIAQLIPGDRIRFECIDLERAQQIRWEHEAELKKMRKTLIRTPVNPGRPQGASGMTSWQADEQAFARRINRYLIQI